MKDAHIVSLQAQLREKEDMIQNKSKVRFPSHMTLNIINIMTDFNRASRVVVSLGRQCYIIVKVLCKGVNGIYMFFNWFIVVVFLASAALNEIFKIGSLK